LWEESARWLSLIADDNTPLHGYLTPASLSPDLKPIVQATRIAAVSATQKNPYLIQRLVQETLPDPKTPAIGFQARALSQNELAADLAALKADGMAARVDRRLTTSKPAATDAASANLGAIRAAAHVQGAPTPSDKIRLARELVERRPLDVGATLALVQLRVDAGQHESALRDLRALLRRADEYPAAVAPGLASLVTTLHRHLGHEPLLRLDAARALSRHLASAAPLAAPRFVQEAAVDLVHSSMPGHLSAAAAAFEALCQDSSSAVAEAGLVAACATTDYAKAEPHLAALPAVSSLVDGIDVAALVADGVATLLRVDAPAPPPQTKPSKPKPSKKRRAPTAEDPSAPATTDAEAGAEAENPRKRAKKLLKSYDPTKKPDPERWLPLRDRSTYRAPKGRKGKKRAGGDAVALTQGGAVKDGDALGLDASARAQQQQGEKTQVLTAAPGVGGGAKRKKRGKK
jgi:signal recognition particle subunit SRP72